MKCPHCGWNDTRVVDSRERESVRLRRRECPQCNKRFTTTELPGLHRPEDSPLFAPVVAKKSGKVEPFDRVKLERSIAAAVRIKSANLPVKAIAAEIESELSALVDAAESRRIGEMILEKLRRLDVMAFIRYASVHREFESPADFAAMLAELNDSESEK